MKLKLVIFMTLYLLSNLAIAIPTAKLTIKVVDEQGVPIEGAESNVVLMLPSRGGGVGTSSGRVSGLSDSNGLFIGEGESLPHVDLSVYKEGYYGTGGKFDDFTGASGFIGFRKYEPWNPTVELVLKKIINPIPMYAVHMHYIKAEDYPQIPVIGKFVGYDLKNNDWVVPYGLGTHRDFLFKLEIMRSISVKDYDVTLTLKFANPGDGFIPYKPDSSKGKSQFRFPHHAPTSGYIDELVQHKEHTPGVLVYGVSGNPDFDTNYFFRVRTELDDDGNVIGGLYGKIHGRIKLGNYFDIPNIKPNISFDYYLNPSNNDTNIEYDPKKNLFKSVPYQLRVSQP